jgi:hypothetical protein
MTKGNALCFGGIQETHNVTVIMAEGDKLRFSMVRKALWVISRNNGGMRRNLSLPSLFCLRI